jgi:hypothetical protein
MEEYTVIYKEMTKKIHEIFGKFFAWRKSSKLSRLTPLNTFEE